LGATSLIVVQNEFLVVAFIPLKYEYIFLFILSIVPLSHPLSHLVENIFLVGFLQKLLLNLDFPLSSYILSLSAIFSRLSNLLSYGTNLYSFPLCTTEYFSYSNPCKS